MTHRQLYNKFIETFPHFVNDQIVYFPNGRNSIRIRGITGFSPSNCEVIFTTNPNGSEWRLESLDYYIDHVMKAH